MAGKKSRLKIKTPTDIKTEADFKRLCASMDPQHQLFCDHYMLTLNAADSYRKAGYKAKGKSAVVNASRLLTNANIQKYINYKMEERKKRLAIDEKVILDVLQSIMKRDILDYYTQGKDGRLQLKDLSKLEPEKRSLVEEISDTQWGLKIKLSPIQPSIDKLGAHLGMWDKNKDQQSGEGVKYIICRYIVPAEGNVVIRPSFTPADAKEIITNHLLGKSNDKIF